jgi:hypothetical protein
MPIPTPDSRPIRAAVTAALLAVVALLAAAAPAGAAGTVHITGKAYRFNQMSTYIEGATIRVREYPNITATTDANGDYDLEVPRDANVTPYIDPGGDYNEIDLQTFHTRGKDIRNANFQTPHDLEYGLLAALLGIEIGPDGRPSECVIVTTVSARNVRGVPYEVFHERTPHGVAGATARTFPALPGPTYFNDSVIPDPSETESSGDGGIIWDVVPPGTYRVVAEHPTTGFASFLASCAPGRVVNANPPWGAYELGAGEKPLRAGIVAAPEPRVRAVRQGRRKRQVVIRVQAAEVLSAGVFIRKARERVVRKRGEEIAVGGDKIKLPVPRGVGRGRAMVEVALTDAGAGRVISKHRIKLPSRRA